MNKAELVSEVAEKVGKSKTEITEIVDIVFDAMTHALVIKDEIRIPGFGVFDTVETAPRKARNPQTGEEVDVPAGIKARFKPGKGLKEAVGAAAAKASKSKDAGKGSKGKR